MTSPQILTNAQNDLEAIIGHILATFVRWSHGRIDTDEFGDKLTEIVHDLDDYRKAYAPTTHERFLQGRDHAEELSQDVYLDAQEETA